MGSEVDPKCQKWVGLSEGHFVMEREHTRVHEENKTEAGKVWWVRWVRLDGDGDSQMKMGTNPDRGSVADCQEDVGPSRGKGTELGVLSAEEGQVFLEEEGFIDLTEHIDTNALVGALVQVTLMDGMAPKVCHAVRAVALMLGQLKSEDIGDAILTRVETKLDAMLGKVAEKQVVASVEAANAVRSVLEKSVEEIKLAARGM